MMSTKAAETTATTATTTADAPAEETARPSRAKMIKVRWESVNHATGIKRRRTVDEYTWPASGAVIEVPASWYRQNERRLADTGDTFEVVSDD